MSWPDDDDGDVLRRLQESGFDFARDYQVDFNVDFFEWPPVQAAIDRLRPLGNIELFDPDDDGPGFVLVQVQAKVTYELVTSMQRRVSNAMAPYGGICESWGVLQ